MMLFVIHRLTSVVESGTPAITATHSFVSSLDKRRVDCFRPTLYEFTDLGGFHDIKDTSFVEPASNILDHTSAAQVAATFPKNKCIRHSLIPTST